MSWLLRLLGLVRIKDLPQDPPPAAEPAPAAPEPARPSRRALRILARAKRIEARRDMGIKVLRGMPVLKAAGEWGHSYGTALRATEEVLRSLPGFSEQEFDAFLQLGPQQRSSHVVNMRQFYRMLRKRGSA